MRAKLNFLFWFYLISGLCMWGAIIFLLCNNALIIAICCWFGWNKWGGYVGKWYMTERKRLGFQTPEKDDDDMDFRDL